MLGFIAGKWTISKHLSFKLTIYILLCQISLYSEIIMLICY